MIMPRHMIGGLDRADMNSYLVKYLDHKVVIWLDDRVKQFLFDYLIIVYLSHDYCIAKIWDYSFLTMPAFKGLEGVMFQIGKQLNFNVDKYKDRVGGMFSEEELDKFYKEVLEKIDTIDKEKKLEIKQWLDSARRILRSLRHNPAHFNGEVKAFEKAFLDGEAILSTINYMCLALIESGVFKPYLEAQAKK